MFASRTAFFAVILDFGEENYEDEELIFGGDKRWLQIGVRPGADTGIFTPLAPRQELRATPYAFFATGAEEAEELEGWFTADELWQLKGNKLNSTTANLLSDGNGQPMEIWVGGMRVWRLERPGGPINVIGGSDGNEVTAGVFSATISGGGANTGNPTLINRVTDALGTVSGGSGNRAGDGDGDVGNAQSANVSGWFQNVASGLGSTVGGGSYAIEGGFLPGADMPNPMAVLLLEYLLGRRSLNAEERQQADVNRDGQIDAADLIASLKI